MKPFRIILLLIPAVFLYMGWNRYQALVNSKPEPKKWGAPAAQTHVDAQRLSTTNFPVIIRSQGTVQPRTESTLIPQVAGEVHWTARSFNEGGFFEEGDILVKLDPSDYKTSVEIAQAALVQAEANLRVEVAQSEQAWENWKRLGTGGTPNPLVVREPQVAEAKAAVTTAKARVDQAERDLDRTIIKAPYAGRILEQLVDVGQFVSSGTILARIYAIDYVEIRLPLSGRQQGYVDLPISYRGEQTQNRDDLPVVTLKGNTLGREIRWQGRIIRTEGAIDTRSRQLFAIAQVDDPYGRKTSSIAPLKVGQFVEAEIEGTTLEKVFAIPRSSIRQDREVLIINDGNQVNRRPIESIFKDGNVALVRNGLKEGELLCLTALPYAADGAMVVPTIDGEGIRMLESQKPKGRPGGPGGGGGGKPGGPSGGKPSGKPDSSSTDRGPSGSQPQQQAKP